MRSFPLALCLPGVGHLPRVPLCDAPTPLEAAPRIAERLGEKSSGRAMGGLWVKRDDLTSTVYGGNKVRKLEFLLGEALA